MNEQALKAVYNDMGFEGQGISYDQFIKTMSTNEEARKSVYSDMGFEGQGVSYDQYESTLGFKKKDQTEPIPSDVSAGESLSPEDLSEEQKRSIEASITEAQKPVSPEEQYAASQEVKDVGSEVLKNQEDKKVIEESIAKDMTPKIDSAKELLYDLSGKEEARSYSDLPTQNALDLLNSNEKFKIIPNSDLTAFIQQEKNKVNLSYGDKYYNNTLEQKKKDFLLKGYSESLASDMAKKSLAEDRLSYGVDRLFVGNPEETDQYIKDIKEYKELRDLIYSRPDHKPTQAELEKLTYLDKSVSNFRESTSGLINPLTGELDNEYTKEVSDIATQISNEFSNDFTKIESKWNKEYNILNGIQYKFEELVDSEVSKVEGGSRQAFDNFTKDMPFAEKLDFFLQRYAHTEDLALKTQSLKEDYLLSQKTFDALDRALLLNEDPAKVSRGFSFLEGIPLLEQSGEALTSFGETLTESILGKEISTDKDFREAVVPALQEAGVKLSEEQIQSGIPTFSEEFGETTGASVYIGAQIALDAAITKGAGSVAKIPKIIAKIGAAKNWSPKRIATMEKLYEGLVQSVAFEVASDETSAVMGAAEFGTAEGMEFLVKKLAGGKLGKFSGLMTRLAGRIVGGTVEEYAGDMAQNLSEFGISEKAFKETFGEGDEAWKKFFLTAAAAGIMGAPVEVMNTIKSDVENGTASGEVTQLYNDLVASKEEATQLEKETTNDKKEGEQVSGPIGEGEESGNIQLDETSEEETPTGGVLQEEPAEEIEVLDFTPEEQAVIDSFEESKLDRSVAEDILIEKARESGLTEAQSKSLVKKYKLPRTGLKTEVRKKTGQTDTSKKVVKSEKELNQIYFNAQKKAGRDFIKNEKKIVSDIFNKVDNLKGKVKASKIKGLMTQLAKTDPADLNQVQELEQKIEGLSRDIKFEEKKAEAIKLQKELKNKGKKVKGYRGETALALSDINLNRIESLDSFLETAKELSESFKAKTNLTEGDVTLESQREQSSKFQDVIDTLIKEERVTSDNIAKRRNELKSARLEEEYLASGLTDEMSLESYKELRADVDVIEEEARAKMIKELGTEKEQAIRKSIPLQIDRLAKFYQENKNLMTPAESKIISSIISNKDIALDRNDFSKENAVDLFSALEEINTFGSTAGTQKVAAILEGVKRGDTFNKKFAGKIKNSLFNTNSLIKSVSNVSTFWAQISDSLETAKEARAATSRDYDISHKKTVNQSNKFSAEKLRLANKLGIDIKESNKIGVISWLKQHPADSTTEEINKDLSDKIESLKNQVKVLKDPGNKSYFQEKRDNRKANALEEILTELNLDNLESKADLDSKLNSKEQEFLSFLENKFAEQLPALSESFRNNKGLTMDRIVNYTPTYGRKVGSKKGVDLDTLESDYSKTSLDREQSGRTIKRQKVDTSGNTIYNFDIVETSDAGMYDVLYDINTMFDREVIANQFKSKGFKDATQEVAGSISDRYAEVMQNRKSRYGRDRAYANKVINELSNIYRGYMVMPLKTIDQFVKQPISIMGATANMVNPKYFALGNTYMLRSSNPEIAEKLTNLISKSSVSVRLSEGDTELAKTDPTYLRLMNAGVKKIGFGEGAVKGVKAVYSDALQSSDNFAAKASWLSFYMQERARQEGKGYKFDLDAESANPNLDAISKADASTDWVNNNSDFTEAGSFFTSSDKGVKALKDTLFLFKSFAINQAMNQAVYARNILSKSKTGKFRAVQALSGSIMGMMLFNMMKEMVVNPGYEALSNSLLGTPDSDEDKPEYFSLDFFKEKLEKSLISTSADLIGFLPDFATDMVKSGINDFVLSNSLKAFEEDPSAFDGKEPSKYDIPFYIDDNPPGIFGLFSSYYDQTDEALDIILSESDVEKKDEVSAMLLMSLIIQDGTMNRLSSKMKRNIEKKIKKEETDADKY